MEYIIMGIVTAFNLIVIKWKLEKERYADGILDLVTLFILGSMFSGSMGGMFVGMVASLVISIYLFIKPPKLPIELTEISNEIVGQTSNGIKDILKELKNVKSV